MHAPRALRRRAQKLGAKMQDYEKSGFIDRSVYQPFPVQDRHKPFTADDLHARAVERRDRKRSIEAMVKLQIKASKEADRARRMGAKAARRKAYLAGFARPQPVKYLHSAARRRLFVSPVAMAA